MLFNLLGVFCWNMLRTPFRRPSSPAVISSFTRESGGPSGPRPCANNDSELGNLGIIETNVVLCREHNPHASTQKHSRCLLDRCRDVPVFQRRQTDSGNHALLVSEFVCFVLFCVRPRRRRICVPRHLFLIAEGFLAICISTRACCCSSPATPAADEWSHLPQPLDSARPP